MPATYATAEQAIAYVPALSTLAAGALAEIVAGTALRINLEAWGVKAYWGHLNLIAHRGVKLLAGSGASAAGPVVSRTIDKLSTSYASPATGANDGDYGSTPYGREYLDTLNSLVIVPIVSDPPAFYARGRY